VGRVEAHRALFGKDAIEEEFQHLHIAGFRQFDRFAHELAFFGFQQRFGD